MIPVISIVGTSNSGKTTLLLKIIKELKLRNYKVATIKHHHEDVELDKPGKDTWRHAQAGADQVALVTPTKVAFYHQMAKEMLLEEVIAQISGVDIIITEGYKKENKPKIEVLRKEVRQEIISKPSDLIAIVSDMSFDMGIPCLNLDDITEIVDIIEDKFLKYTENLSG